MTRRRPAQSGFTLIEMMVSLIIMTIVIGGVLRMAGTLTSAYQDSRRTSVAERNARAVLDIITDTVRNASPGVPRSDLQDLVGCSGTGGIKVTNSSTGPDQLDVIHAIGGVVTSLRAPFTASDTSLTVLDGSELRAGDYIIVTNLDKGHILEVADVQPSGSEYVITLAGAPSGLCSGVVFPSGDYSAGDLVVRAQVSRFYVDSSSTVDYLPTMMMDPDGDGPAAAEPLAGGIEDFQVAVGVDTNSDQVLTDTASTGDEWFYNAVGDVDPPAITTTPPRALRITVVGRTLTEQSTQATMRRPAAEDHAAASTLDPYRRRVLSATVEIRNLEGSP